MKAINIINELRDKYCKKYRMTPDNHKGHYINWLQDEYAELAMKQANDVDLKNEECTLHGVSFAKRKVCRCYEVPPKQHFEKCDTCGRAYQYIRQT